VGPAEEQKQRGLQNSWNSDKKTKEGKDPLGEN